MIVVHGKVYDVLLWVIGVLWALTLADAIFMPALPSGHGHGLAKWRQNFRLGAFTFGFVVCFGLLVWLVCVIAALIP
eukprot:JP437954.1.p2 GENE.JP437954.1~~JP437954.1.p2  ORF type:complete len:77 (-),score=10.27 JP437954.1:9-239(-)